MAHPHSSAGGVHKLLVFVDWRGPRVSVNRISIKIWLERTGKWNRLFPSRYLKFRKMVNKGKNCVALSLQSNLFQATFWNRNKKETY